MIPTDPEELSLFAGEYVLGTLDDASLREADLARATNRDLQQAILFWEEKLAALGSVADPAEPPADTWDAIAARLAPPPPTVRPIPWWEQVGPWRWATAGLAAVAAALAIYIAQPGNVPVRPMLAVLHDPSGTAAAWVATVGRDGLDLRAVARVAPPTHRVYELWAIASGRDARPRPLGVVTADGRLCIASLPSTVTAGATLAISVEPPGGSPTGLPTGPVVFVGALGAM